MHFLQRLFKKERYKLSDFEFEEYSENMKKDTYLLEKIRISQVEILRKYCPFVDGHCFNECVHFFPGEIISFNGSDFLKIKPETRVITAACKLQNRQFASTRKL